MTPEPIGRATRRRDDAAFADPSLEGRRLFAEAWGTFLLVLVACGAGAVSRSTGEPGAAAAAVAPGLLVMAVIYTMGAVSGAHLNPAVSFAFALRGNFPWRRVPAYVVAQVIGALAAAALLRALVGMAGDLGATTPAHGMDAWHAVVLEAVLTAALVHVILGTAAGARNVGPNGAIAVGGTIALSGVWAGPLSGASMNPARSLAPDVLRGDLATTWIYVVGPLAGAMVGVAFQRLLKGPPTAEGSRSAQGEPPRPRRPRGRARR